LAPTVVSFDDDRSTPGWTAAWSNAESAGILARRNASRPLFS
jgi:hypothetical protein